MASTFNDPQILEDWRVNHRWPAIHGKIAAAAQMFIRGPRVLDLCCSFGLLGQRLLKTCPNVEKVIGVDCDDRAMGLGRAAGIAVDMHSMKITPDTVHLLYDLIKREGITTIVARRAFPELFGENHQFGRDFAISCNHFGVRELLLEGRVESRRSSNSLCGIDLEVELVRGSYELTGAFEKCAYLQPKGWDTQK